MQLLDAGESEPDEEAWSERVDRFTWGVNIIGGARAAIDESFDRYLTAIR